jgi:hypothetical protein
VLWAGAIGFCLALPGWALSPERGLDVSAGRNPVTVDGLPVDGLLAVGMTLFLFALLASALSLVLRFRRSRGVERQQLKLFALVAALAGALLPVVFALWYVSPIALVLAPVVLTALPVAICVAILRYRLYDIDVLIDRTVVYVTVTALLAAAYGATALILGTTLGRGSAWATAGATLVVAVAFRPLRDRVQDVVDRQFHRARYRAVRRMSEFLDALRAGRTAPEEVEGVLRELLEDPGLRLLVFLPESEIYVGVDGVPATVPDDDRVERIPIDREGAPVGVVLHRGGRDDPALVRDVVEASTSWAPPRRRTRAGRSTTRSPRSPSRSRSSASWRAACRRVSSTRASRRPSRTSPGGPRCRSRPPTSPSGPVVPTGRWSSRSPTTGSAGRPRSRAPG